MRVLVLGGNRYIGLSLVRELARCGFEVTAAGGRDLYDYDFSFEDEVLARTGQG